MSERMTAINLPSAKVGGLAEWGQKTPAEMIETYREQARRMKREAEEILSARDDDFRIETFFGPYARRNLTVIQQGRAVLSRARGEQP